MRKINYLLLIALSASIAFLSGCGDDDVPAVENEEEIITDVILTFSPIGGGTDAVALAQDPDGEGPQDLQVAGAINLEANKNYQLKIDLINSLTKDNISDEVAQEDDEHMFFFGFTDALFLSPDGDGNIDNRGDTVDYVDNDANGNPLGLTTTWATVDTQASGTFRIVLKHQPGVKSATSTVEDGETDLDLMWKVVVQ